jgi:L1 cell adhesion molecule like protein
MQRPPTTVYSIDVGTESCIIGCFSPTGPQIISAHGEISIPSVVTYNPSGIRIGRPALHSMAQHPMTTFFDSKRLVGRNFNDPMIEQRKRNWPFELSSQNCGGIKYSLPPESDLKEVTPLK